MIVFAGFQPKPHPPLPTPQSRTWATEEGIFPNGAFCQHLLVAASFYSKGQTKASEGCNRQLMNQSPPPEDAGGASRPLSMLARTSERASEFIGSFRRPPCCPRSLSLSNAVSRLGSLVIEQIRPWVQRSRIPDSSAKETEGWGWLSVCNCRVPWLEHWSLSLTVGDGRLHAC